MIYLSKRDSYTSTFRFVNKNLINKFANDSYIRVYWRKCGEFEFNWFFPEKTNILVTQKDDLLDFRFVHTFRVSWYTNFRFTRNVHTVYTRQMHGKYSYNSVLGEKAMA